MIKALIIAGEFTKQLVKNLDERGTIQVEYSFENIVENEETITNSIISVDKLLYFCTNNALGIPDMKRLKNIIDSKEFFSVKEYIFIGDNSEETLKVKEFFETVMSMSKINTYYVKIFNKHIGYTDINEVLIGTSKRSNFTNVFQDMVIVDTADEAKVAYSKTKDSKLKIEPFNYNSLNTYKDNVNSILKLDGSIEYKDSDPVPIKKINNLVLPKLEISKERTGANVFVITGADKTGKTIFTCANAYSSMINGKSVGIIDYTNNTDVSKAFINDNIPINLLGMKEIIQGAAFSRSTINIIASKSDVEVSARLDFLQHLFSSNYKLNLDVIFLVLPQEFLNDVLYLLSYSIASIWVCSSRIKEDIVSVSGQLITLVKNYDVSLVLSDIITLKDNNSFLEPEVIKTIIPKDIKLIKPLKINTINAIGKGLYEQLILTRIGE